VETKFKTQIDAAKLFVPGQMTELWNGILTSYGVEQTELMSVDLATGITTATVNFEAGTKFSLPLNIQSTGDLADYNKAAIGGLLIIELV
jgi:hypothetical protein